MLLRWFSTLQCAILLLRVCAAAASLSSTRVWITAARESVEARPLRYVISAPADLGDLKQHVERRLQGMLRAGYACVRIKNIVTRPRSNTVGVSEKIGCSDDIFLSLHFNFVHCAPQRNRNPDPQPDPTLPPTPTRQLPSPPSPIPPPPVNLRATIGAAQSLKAVSAELGRLEEKLAVLNGNLKEDDDLPVDPLVVDAQSSSEFSHGSLPTLLWLAKHFLAGFVIAAAVGALSCWSFAYHADLADLCPSPSAPSSKTRKKSTAVAIDPDPHNQKHGTSKKKKNKKKKNKKAKVKTRTQKPAAAKSEVRQHELRIQRSLKKLKHLLAEAGPWSTTRDRDGVLTLACRGNIMPVGRAVALCGIALEATDDGDDEY
jgi:hypothetical protein